MDLLRLSKLALLVAATMTLTTAIVLMVTQCRIPADAQTPSPCVGGDVNADGVIDIADPVYLLSYLFDGGPAPVACPPAGLPDTGQVECHDTAGNVVDCASACPGQDGAYLTGCPSAGRFVDNGDGTVTDNCTGLMWQQNTADMNGDGSATLDDGQPWCDALAYCESLNFAGYSDWRLPNVRELESIVDYGQTAPSTVFDSFAEYAEGTGRDHYSYGFTMWLAGGGVRGGISVGETAELGAEAVTNRLHVKHLHATVLHLLGLDPNRLTYFHGGLDQKLVGVEGAEPIWRVLG